MIERAIDSIFQKSLVVDNIEALAVHFLYCIFLFCKLRKESHCISLLFISQIPLQFFPLFRFSWSLSQYSLPCFIITNFSILLFLFWSTNKNDFLSSMYGVKLSTFNARNAVSTTHFERVISFWKIFQDQKVCFVAILFVFSTLLSVFASTDVNNSFLSSFYIVCWFLALYLSFHSLRNNQRLILLSLYLFLMSCAVFMGFIIYSYIRKYGFPLSFQQIYQNKLTMTAYIPDQLRITGNAHNVAPLVFFTNILSFTLILFFAKNKNNLHNFDFILNLKLPSISKIIYLNMFISLTFFLLFLMRGAIIFMILCYVIFYLRLFDKKRKRNLLIGCSLIGIFYYFSNEDINNYFCASCISLYDFCLNFLLTGGKASNLADTSVSERLESFLLGIKIIQENFFLGIGINNYSIVEKIYTSPHNIIIQHVAETGFFGFILIIILFSFLIKEALSKKADMLFCLAYGAISFFLYMTFFGGQFFTFGMFINGLTLFYSIFLIYGLKRIHRENHDEVALLSLT